MKSFISSIIETYTNFCEQYFQYLKVFFHFHNEIPCIIAYYANLSSSFKHFVNIVVFILKSKLLII